MTSFREDEGADDESAGIFGLCVRGENLLGEDTLPEPRLSGELRAYVFRCGVGDPVIIDVRREVFFLMDKGSTVVGAAGAGVGAFLGVVSVLPVGKNGCRLLRGIPVGASCRLEGVADGHS